MKKKEVKFPGIGYHVIAKKVQHAAKPLSLNRSSGANTWGLLPRYIARMSRHCQKIQHEAKPLLLNRSSGAKMWGLLPRYIAVSHHWHWPFLIYYHKANCLQLSGMPMVRYSWEYTHWSKAKQTWRQNQSALRNRQSVVGSSRRRILRIDSHPFQFLRPHEPTRSMNDL